MTDRIGDLLRRHFEEHRLVFWYDKDHDMRAEFESFESDEIKKVEIKNNEFGLKHQILLIEPKQKFLLFKDGPAPEMKDNWLLDLQLAAVEFKADQAAIWMSELALPREYEPAVRNHKEFYKSQRRRERLKELEQQKPSRSIDGVRRKMLIVSAGVDGDISSIIESLLGELAKSKDDTFPLLERTNLSGFFWGEVERTFGYSSEVPNFEDFAISLFQSAYERAFGEGGRLNEEALLAFKRWKNDRNSSDAFAVLSGRYQKVLDVRQDIGNRDFKTLEAIDYFEEIDCYIIQSLISSMSNQSLGSTEALRIVRGRRRSHWYSKYKDLYEAIEFAAAFKQALSGADFGITDVNDGVRKYVSSWFRLDQLYRKFIFHMQKSEQPSLLADLFNEVENLYSNSFLLKVNDAWQDQIAHLKTWEIDKLSDQRDFYSNQVGKFRRRDQKVVVVISDALRFEIAEECLTEIRKLNRFSAELSPMLCSLPSYTQLGMAALLPNKDLSIASDSSASVLSYGEPTKGLNYREKILGQGRKGDRVKAMKSKDFVMLSSEQGKELFRNHDTLYIYHNRIDATGDSPPSEDNVPEAAERAIEDLVTLVRSLSSANFSNILITSDHGFLYQHRALEESEFSLAEPTGEELVYRNRRFVLGRNLAETSGMKKFSSSSLGLSGDLDALFPNSINRLRVQGAGNRYVHGGTSLQEVILPVLQVRKQRRDDVSLVDVQIIVTGRNLISSGQIAVTIYQEQPVSEKRQKRELRVGIFASDKTLISDQHDLEFDFSSENPRERELKVKLLLSRSADAYNNQDVFLKLQQRVGKTSHYEDYKSQPFQLRRGLSTDFDL